MVLRHLLLTLFVNFDGPHFGDSLPQNTMELELGRNVCEGSYPCLCSGPRMP